LAVNASYPIQFLFEKGYGNYLGLYRLGQFVAHEVNRELTQFTCNISTARLGGTRKTQLQVFAADVQGLLQGQTQPAELAAGAGGNDDNTR
jgi:hypothetical protein